MKKVTLNEMDEKIVAVVGMGMVTALGNNISHTWQRLLLGETGISLQQPFPELPKLPLATVTPRPTSPLVLLEQALEMALADAGYKTPLENCGVVIGSSRSQQGLWEKWAAGNYLEREFPWLSSLPQMLAIEVAKKLGVTGLVSSPNAACATSHWAIAQAVEWLQTQKCQRVILGAVESCISPLNIAGFAKLGALAKTKASPFDKQREGMVLGEGAAVLVLELQPIAHFRQSKTYGRILGFGLSNDAYHRTALDPDYQTAATAIKNCLQRSQIATEQVSFIHTHGTGTRLNDQREANLIKAVFPNHTFIISTKGATGHTLGASGMLGTVFSLLTLQQQILPPCVGLEKPEYNLNFVREAQTASLETALCLSFGFGGQNAVIAFGN
ncbi:beta-ketoacyl-ACP synthase [Oscillatoria salina]|uniref:beta-ketoacyl-ACP synthase n=1 Tax=Oscillatoria salina TaxID=331517 RepID=UPI001CCFF528|nr:beta-ketoacyl-ACP synthase [Oscillatoria salina]